MSEFAKMTTAGGVADTAVWEKTSDTSLMTFWKPAKPFVSPFVMHKKPATPVPSINAEQLAAAAVPVPLSILVVEDNRVNRLLTMKMLNHLGYQADVAGDGRECLEAMARKTYHLFLMDLQMPVMDGFTTSREIRRWYQTNPPAVAPYICALTANAMTKDREESLAAGMDDFLTKPLRLESLKIVVKRVTENLKNHQNRQGD